MITRDIQFDQSDDMTSDAIEDAPLVYGHSDPRRAVNMPAHVGKALDLQTMLMIGNPGCATFNFFAALQGAFRHSNDDI